MKTKNILIAAMVSMFLTACTDDVSLEDNARLKSSESIRISVTDELMTSATRAVYSGFPSTSFEEGDAIGIYVFNGSSYVTSNIRFVKQSDGSWLPDNTVPYNENYSYYAYFPYRATVYTPVTSGTVDAVDTKFASFISDASNYFWQADQSTKAGFTYSNLMIAKGNVTNVNENTATVSFTMKHKRSLAVFSGGSVSDLTFTGNIPYLVGDTEYFLMKPTVSTVFNDGYDTYTLSASVGEYVTKSVSSFVDLGLPSGLLWAKCNIGAVRPEDPGLYFAWGDIRGYRTGTHAFSTDSYNGTVVNGINISALRGELNPMFDVATVSMGWPCRMPTVDDRTELLANTSRVWTTQNGVGGILFTSTVNGNKLFLPAGGRIWDAGTPENTNNGAFWLNTSYSDMYSCRIRINSSDMVNTEDHNDWCTRRAGFNIRAVRESVNRPYDSEVEYLESTGTQCIDALVKLYKDGDANFQVDMKVNVPSASNSNNACIFNAMYENSPYPGAVIRYNSTTSDINRVTNGISEDNLKVGDVNTDQIISTTITQPGVTHQVSATLFAGLNGSGNVWRQCKMKLYYCKIYDHGVLVRDFIPVVFNNKGCLYDKVSQCLFPNAGTGTFNVGSVKND